MTWNLPTTGDISSIYWYISSVIASSISMVILITCIIVAEWFNRTKLLNRLSNVPYFAILLYIIDGIIKEILFFCKLNNEDTKIVLAIGLLSSVKATSVYVTTAVQFLEWLSLSHLMRFQAENPNKISALLEDYQARERRLLLIF